MGDALLMLPLLQGPAAHVVNVSGVAGSQITAGPDPDAIMRAPAYSFAKHVLNVDN